MNALILAIALTFAPANWLTFSDASDRYSIKYPDTWEISVQENVASFLAAQEGETDQFRENVNVLVQDLSATPTTMAEYTQATTDWVKESGGTLQLQREITLAGQPATEVAYTMPANAIGIEMELMFHQVWILKGANAYLLTYTAEPGKYEKYEQDAAEIFKSFVLKQ